MSEGYPYHYLIQDGAGIKMVTVQDQPKVIEFSLPRLTSLQHSHGQAWGNIDTLPGGDSGVDEV